MQNFQKAIKMPQNDINVILLFTFYEFLDNFNEFLKILHKIWNVRTKTKYTNLDTQNWIYKLDFQRMDIQKPNIKLGIQNRIYKTGDTKAGHTKLDIQKPDI